jgi:predicted kinase
MGFREEITDNYWKGGLSNELYIWFKIKSSYSKGAVVVKRLVIMTVGKTHSGKTTFATALEQELANSIVIDQDNHGEFINTFYKKLQPKQGPNTLKHAISRLIVDYAIEQSDFHLIICNSNRNRKVRLYFLEQLFHKNGFISILVHFDIPDHVLLARVTKSQRSTNIFRGAYSNFEEVLTRQQADSLKEDVTDPVEGEADHLFVIKDNEEVDAVIQKIVHIAQSLWVLSDRKDHLNDCSANDLLSNRKENGAYCFANIGQQYAVYFPKHGAVDLDQWVYNDEWQVRWLHNAERKWDHDEIVLVEWELAKNDYKINGKLTLPTPGPGSWVAFLNLF